MITKTIQLEFANPSIRAIDYIHDIRRAAEKAGLNLFSRYGVQLQYPSATQDEKVVVEIKIPNELANNFAVGNHLRGISDYLLRYHGDRYRKMLVGKRLLNYIEVSGINHSSSDLLVLERLEAIASFANLLTRKDPKATEAINMIISIIRSADD